MKKITILSFLLLSFISNAQTYAIYTEDPTVGAGLNNLRFSNGQGFALSEPVAAPFEGTKNYLLTYNATSSYFHAIFIPRNAANTGDITIDIAAYSYYNLAMKTSSASPFYIRIKGNAINAKVLIDPSNNSYGFSNDNQWHFMSIPLSAFIPEAATFSLTSVTEVFVLRSNLAGSTVGTMNDFEVDNIYVSTSEVLSVPKNTKASVKIYPNPVKNSLNVNSEETLESVKIYNLLGQKVLELNPNNAFQSIDVSALKSGTYLVQTEANGKRMTTKFLKE